MVLYFIAAISILSRMRVGKNDMVVGYGLHLFILGGPEEAVSQLQKRPVPPSYL